MFFLSASICLCFIDLVLERVSEKLSLTTVQNSLESNNVPLQVANGVESCFLYKRTHGIYAPRL